MTATLPVPWAMPQLPPGWSVRKADIDEIGYWLGRRLDVEQDRAINIRFEHAQPLAYARVALRTLDELVDFLARLEGMTPYLRHGMHIEVNYY